MSHRRWLVTILPIIVVSIVLYVVFSGKHERNGFSEVGTIPDFVLKDYRSRAYDSGDLWGKVVAIVFWKVSVASSVAELKGLDLLRLEYRDRGFEALGICLDGGDGKYVRSFANRHRVKIPLLIGGVETAHLFGGLRGVPTTFIFDREGRVIDVLEGFRGKGDLEERILKLLE